MEEILALWRKALTSKVGFSIETNDRVLLRQQLYRVRAEAGDPALDEIVILFPIHEDQLWLVRRDATGS